MLAQANVSAINIYATVSQSHYRRFKNAYRCHLTIECVHNTTMVSRVVHDPPHTLAARARRSPLYVHTGSNARTSPAYHRKPPSESKTAQHAADNFDAPRRICLV